VSDEHPVNLSAVILARHNDGVAFSIQRISTGGARLVGPLTLEVGERVQVLFELEGTPIDVEGEVVRVERPDIVNDHVAVAFRNLSDSSRTLIHELVQRSMNL
jgi:hypothetical protein